MYDTWTRLYPEPRPGHEYNDEGIQGMLCFLLNFYGTKSSHYYTVTNSSLMMDLNLPLLYRHYYIVTYQYPSIFCAISYFIVYYKLFTINVIYDV